MDNNEYRAAVATALEGHTRNEDYSCSCGWAPKAGSTTPSSSFNRHTTSVLRKAGLPA